MHRLGIMLFFLVGSLPVFGQKPSTVIWEGKVWNVYPYRLPFSSKGEGEERIFFLGSRNVNLHIPAYPGKLPDGDYLAYYPKSGKYMDTAHPFNFAVAATFQIRNNQTDGPARFYTKRLNNKGKQKVYLRGTYERGFKTGRWVFLRYNDYGYFRDSFRLNFTNGVPDGPCASWNYKGKLITTGFYKNGRKDSTWKLYLADGQSQTYKWKNGEIHIVNEFYKEITNTGEVQYEVESENITYDTLSAEYLTTYRIYTFPERKLILTIDPVSIGSLMFDSINHCVELKSGELKTYLQLMFGLNNMKFIDKVKPFYRQWEYFCVIKCPDFPGRWIAQKHGRLYLPEISLSLTQPLGMWQSNARKMSAKKRNTAVTVGVDVRRLTSDTAATQQIWEQTYLLNGIEIMKFLTKRTSYDVTDWKTIYHFHKHVHDLEYSLNETEILSQNGFKEYFEPEYYAFKEGKIPHIYISYVLSSKTLNKNTYRYSVIGENGIIELWQNKYTQNIPIWKDEKIIAFRKVYSYRTHEGDLQWEYVVPFRDWDSLNPKTGLDQTSRNRILYESKMRSFDEEFISEDGHIISKEEDIWFPKDYHNTPFGLPYHNKNLYLPNESGLLKLNDIPYTGYVLGIIYKNPGRSKQKNTKYINIAKRHGSNEIVFSMFAKESGAQRGEFQQMSLYFDSGRLSGVAEIRNYPVNHNNQASNQHGQKSELRQKGRYEKGRSNGMFTLYDNLNGETYEYTYINGVREGLQFRTYLNTQVSNRWFSAEQQYYTLKNGVKDGVCFYKTADNIFEGTFNHGKPDGEVIIKSYNNTSSSHPADFRWNKRVKMHFRNGVPDGGFELSDIHNPVVKLPLRNGVLADTGRFYTNGSLSHMVIPDLKSPHIPLYFDSAFCGVYIARVIPVNMVLSENRDPFLFGFDYQSSNSFDFNNRIVLSSETWPGKHVWYYHNGNISAEGSVDSAVRKGWWKFYTEYGVLYKEIFYEKQISPFPGETTTYPGVVRSYDHTGKLLNEGFIQDERFSNVCATEVEIPNLEVRYTKIYDSAGNDIYTEGKHIPVVEYQLSGNKLFEGWIKDGKRDSLWKFFTLNGSLEEIGHYRGGLRQGYWFYGSLEGVNFQDNICFQENEIQKRLESMKRLKFITTIYNQGIAISENGVEVRTDGYSEYHYSTEIAYWDKVKIWSSRSFKKRVKSGEDLIFPNRKVRYRNAESLFED